jgi:flagellar biosynthesis/type III secretory pathway protein FliH
MTRTKNIKIRLTEDEFQRLKRRAGKRGVSALLRNRALGPDTRQIQSEKFAVLAEFTRARNLLNQIARSCQRQLPLAVIEIVSQLIAVERQLSIVKKS